MLGKLEREYAVFQLRFAAGSVDVLIAFDLLGAATDAQLRGASVDRTIVIGSASPTPTGKMVLHPTVAYPELDDLAGRLNAISRADLNRYAPVFELVTGLFGDTTTANVFLLGVAHQAGVLPVSTISLERAISLNGVAVDRNLAAFAWGRQWIIDPDSVATASGVHTLVEGAAEPLDPIAMRAADLVAYQSQEYSQLYLDRIETLRAAGASAETIDAFAIHLHKLMAYKDEYEVARLLLAPEARAAAEAIAGEGARVQWQLHPPMLRALGMKSKISLGRWATPLMVGLRAGRRLRGTPFDLLGMTKLRRIERALAGEYADSITVLVRANAPASVTLEAAGLPELVRGYESIKLESLVHYRARLAEFMNPAGSAEPDSVPAD